MNKQTRLNNLIKSASNLNGVIKILRKKYNKKRDTIINLMNRDSIKKYDSGQYIVTMYRGYKKKVFSLPKFRKLEPKLYQILSSNDKFQRISKRKPSIRLKKKLVND